LAVTATPAEIWTAARHDLAMFFGYIEGAEVVLRGSAMVGLSGGPTADFNMALFGDDPENAAVFDQFVSRTGSIRVPAVAMFSSGASRRLGARARARGLVEAGTAPLMVRSGPVPDARESDFVCQRITAVHEMPAFGELVAAAFSLDKAWVNRTFASAALLDAPALNFFVAYRRDLPISGVTTTGAGRLVGIWSMSTPPDKQRQGAGQAILIAAMQDHIKRGAETFYLVATAAGKPLYDKLGFETIDELSIWLAGESSQLPAH
jgi:hypothetical protein